MKFAKGQIYEKEDACIYVKGVSGENVRIIEGISPSAIHDIQELPADSLQEHIEKWGYTRASAELEAFVDC